VSADDSEGSAPDAAGDAPVTGPDLARAALAAARAAARARGISPGGPARRSRALPPLRSGAGPDGRDPLPFGAAIARLVQDRGWQEQTAAGRVLGDWAQLVGPEIADHCRPASLVDGALVLVAESSAWATQLRLLTRTLQSRLDAQVGAGVVTSVVVRGPSSPDWRKGPRRVRGRGPRDTYG
jgi:predicted nucleic acid-binding Zn ribbon protein